MLASLVGRDRGRNEMSFWDGVVKELSPPWSVLPFEIWLAEIALILAFVA